MYYKPTYNLAKKGAWLALLVEFGGAPSHLRRGRPWGEAEKQVSSECWVSLILALYH